MADRWLITIGHEIAQHIFPFSLILFMLMYATFLQFLQTGESIQSPRNGQIYLWNFSNIYLTVKLWYKYFIVNIKNFTSKNKILNSNQWYKIIIFIDTKHWNFEYFHTFKLKTFTLLSEYNILSILGLNAKCEISTYLTRSDIVSSGPHNYANNMIEICIFMTCYNLISLNWISIVWLRNEEEKVPL